MSDSKSLLNELCQKLHLQLPNYHSRQHALENNQLVYMADVHVNGEIFQCTETFKRKKEAENAAAAVALQQMVTNTEGELTSNRLPEQYSAIEEFFVEIIKPHGGHIRKGRFEEQKNVFWIEIAGGYRYCENVQRHHQQNQIYFVVNPKKMIYFQRCHDPNCRGFQSAAKSINIAKHNDSANQS